MIGLSTNCVMVTLKKNKHGQFIFFSQRPKKNKIKQKVNHKSEFYLLK